MWSWSSDQCDCGLDQQLLFLSSSTSHCRIYSENQFKIKFQRNKNYCMLYFVRNASHIGIYDLFYKLLSGSVCDMRIRMDFKSLSRSPSCTKKSLKLNKRSIASVPYLSIITYFPVPLVVPVPCIGLRHTTLSDYSPEVHDSLLVLVHLAWTTSFERWDFLLSQDIFLPPSFTPRGIELGPQYT